MRALPLCALTAAVASSAWATEADSPKCLLFLADRVGWVDVAAGRMPTLRALPARGAAGWCSPATARPMTRLRAYATLGAGNRADGPERLRAEPAGQGARVTNVAEWQAANRHLPYSVEIGSLGGALHRGGLKTAVCGTGGLDAAALLVAMDERGRVDYLGALQNVYSRADLVVLQGPEGSPEEADRGLAAALALRREQDLLILLAPTPDASDMVALAPVLVLGLGFPPATALTSRTTLRPGLVANIDVAPTVLRFFGLPLPPSYVNNAPMTAAPPGLTAGELAAFEVLTRRVHEARRLFIPLFTAWHLVVVVAALALAWRPVIGVHRARRLRWVPLSVPAALVVGYALPLVQRPGWPVAAILAAGLAGTVLLTVAVARLCPSLRTAAAVVSLLAVLLIGGDVLHGGELQMRAVPGYAVALGGRFYGLGNEGTAVLVAAAAVLGGLVVGGQVRPVPLACVLLLLAAVTVLVGAPCWGADAGGALLAAALVVAYLVALLARRVRWWHGLALAAAMVAAAAVVVAADLHRPPDEMTHIGRAWLRITGEGPAAAWEIISRKLFTSWNVSVASPWALAPMAWVLAFSFVLLRPRGLVARWLAVVPGLRPTAAAVVVGGLIGWAVNDSAVGVPAMMLAFVVPLVAAAALSVAGGEGPDAARD